MRPLATLCLAVLAVMLVSSCESPEAAKRRNELKELVRKKCSQCHFSDIIYSEPRAAEEWGPLVVRMRAINPALLNQQEIELIVEYLEENASK